MLNRLNTDKSLAKFSGQFVPIKLTTAGGNKDWAQWNRSYPTQLRAIPIVYVVRADGKQLYADSGSLPGNQLTTMLATTLAQSGQQFSPAQASMVAKQVDVADAALQEKDLVAAAQALKSLASLGQISEWNTYAESAVRAKEVFAELSTQMVAGAESALEASKDSDSPFEHVLKIVEINSAARPFAQIRNKTQPLANQLQKDSKLRMHLKPSEFLVKAREAAGSSKTKRRSETAYASVIRNHAGSRAAEIAREELMALNPDSKGLMEPGTGESTESKSDSAFRLWSSSDGKFSVRGSLQDADDSMVKLKTPDGKEIKVPLEKLSDKDKEHIQTWRELFQ